MTTTETPHTIGGHHAVHIGTDGHMPTGDQALFRCDDCRTTAGRQSFLAGTAGCPGRPESLNYLTVCPGGNHCDGHPDTDSAEWRAYAASSTIPLTTVPRITCPAEELGQRAARQYLAYADKIGLKMSAWAQQAMADKIGAPGGIVAEFTHNGTSYAVHVDALGKISAHRFSH